MKYLRIKNMDIQAFFRLLEGLTLRGQESRMRTKLSKLIEEHNNIFLAPSFMKLAEEYAVTDENGDYVYIDKEAGRIDVMEGFKEEQEILLNEEFIIEANEANKRMILSCSKVLLDGDFDVYPDQAVVYDYVCEQLEEIVTYYEELENGE